MNERITFQILRDVFNILSYATAEDLKAASADRKASPRIAQALECLADEAASGGHVTPRASASENRRNESRAEDPLVRAIVNSPRFGDKRSIAELARLLGIKFSIDPKDSLARVQSRLLNSLKILSDADKAAAIRSLQGKSMKDLEGWLDVINRKT